MKFILKEDFKTNTKNKSRRNIFNLFFLFAFSILIYIAFKFSLAQKPEPAQIKVIDIENNLNQVIEDTFLNEVVGAGKYLILPEKVDGKYIKEYYVKSTEELKNTSVEKKEILKPGDKLFVTKEEQKTKIIELETKYDYKEILNKKVYKKEIIKKVENDRNDKNVKTSEIRLLGYVPEEANIKIYEKEFKDILKKQYPDIFEEKRDVDKIFEFKIYEDPEMSFEDILKLEEVLKEEKPEIKITFDGINKNVAYDITSLKVKDETFKSKSKQDILFNLDKSQITKVDLEDAENIAEVKTYIKFNHIPTGYIVISNLKKESKEKESGLEISDPIITPPSRAKFIPIHNEGMKAKQWDGTSVSNGFKFGTGAIDNPYLITNAEELAYLSESVRNGNRYDNQYFQLVRDIDLASHNFTPIGNERTPFGGNFDGAGRSIKNLYIELNNYNLSYNETNSMGLFGFVGGIGVSQEIKNFTLINPHINVNTQNFIRLRNIEIHFGLAVGTLRKGVDVKGISVINGKIEERYQNRMNNNTFLFFVGGLVGKMENGGNISNVYVDVNINLTTIFRSQQRYADRYVAGGIVGKMEGTNNFPKHTISSANISSNGMIGLVFGAQHQNVNENNQIYLNDQWQGENYNYINLDNRYTHFIVNGRQMTASISTGMSNNRLGNNNSRMEYYQGLNKGNYSRNEVSNLEYLNTGEGKDKVEFILSSGHYILNPRYVISISEVDIDVFKTNIQNKYTKTFSEFKWYENGEEKTKYTGDTFNLEQFSTEKDILIEVIVKDGDGYYTYQNILVPKVYLDIKVDKNNLTAEVKISGTGLKYTNINDFKFSWDKEDVVGERTNIQGQNSYKYTTNTLESEKYDFIVKANNTKYPQFNKEIFVSFVNRDVIYVSEQRGNDYNDGRSPERPVQYVSAAYSRIPDTGSVNTNIIVIMGKCDSNESFNSERSTQYSKNATLTGKYKNTEYNGSLTYYSSVNSEAYKYINGDIVFTNLVLNGGVERYSWWSGTYHEEQQLYMYLQGNSLEMGKNVRMENYARSNTNQGLISANAPAFHIFAAWLRYDYAQLPKNDVNIVIKSGAYGRIVMGGSPGTNDERNLRNTTSKNFTGSSFKDMFNVNVEIDIQNSTKGSYDYDINLLVGGSAAGNTYANVVQTIKNGSIGRILGASIGDSSSVPSGWNYPTNTFIGTVKMNLLGGEITEVYGGSLGRNMNAIGRGSSRRECDSYFYGNIEINVDGSSINGHIYGAGAGGVSGYSVNSSDPYSSYGKNVETKVNINLVSGNIKGNIYGGGYGYTNYLTPNTLTNDAGALYGNSYINISNNININGKIYGAGRGKDISSKPNIAQMYGNTKIELKGTPNITGEIYGGGEGNTTYPNMAKLNGKSNININLINGFASAANIYGGGDNAKVLGETHIDFNSGTILNQIYGGGNKGEIIGETYVKLKGGIAGDIFGGGNEEGATKTNVILNNGNAKNVYGGANMAGLNETYVKQIGSNVEHIYGGSNLIGNVVKTIVDIDGGNTTEVYGGNNQGGSTNTSVVNLNGGHSNYVFGGGNQTGGNITNVNVNNGYFKEIFGGSNYTGEIKTANVLIDIKTSNEEVKINNIFGGNNLGGRTNTSNITLRNGNINNIYGGSNRTDIGTSNIEVLGGSIKKAIFGGSNEEGTANKTNVNIRNGKHNTVYGGNNQGGKTENAKINIYAGNIKDIYGGGNLAETDTTNVNIIGGNIQNVFGGGNLAKINTGTNLIVTGGKINKNIYGGGNEGEVEKNTFVDIRDSQILGSVYAGGNGSLAIVKEKTVVNINDGAVIGKEDSKIPYEACVFGSGNAAATGAKGLDTKAETIVNIVGGEIFGNVYGGANTSVVYGKTNLNIGIHAANTEDKNGLKKGNIYIKGTIFGGGEANAEGSENYDFSFISVTDAIDINIDGLEHEKLDTEGSVFGSGNASSSSGISKIRINNYGNPGRPGRNISLQRANEIILENTYISLSGTTDRTNEYSNEKFSISRVDHLKSTKNSTIYLECGANLLKEYSSMVDSKTGELATAEIKPSGTTKINVNNRIYMYEGKNLNIATNESVTTYGQVNGMTFFGLYTNKYNPASSSAFYGREYNNGDNIVNPGTFTYNSYVLGFHKPNHDIKKDGFYTNYNKNGKVKTDYVGVTPEDELYYMWIVGDALDVTTYEVTLTASKYATLGTYELPLIGFSVPNTKYLVSGFSAGMTEGVKLLENKDIPDIEENEKNANNNFGLKIKASRTGWKTIGETNFMVSDNSSAHYTGKTSYVAEDAPITPSFLLYLYHSQNLTEEKELGEATVRYQVLEPVDDLNYKVRYIDIKITMLTALYQEYFYEAAVTPGEEFEIFTTTETNITENSIFTSYFSLLLDDFKNTKYAKDFLNLNRKLVSRDSQNNPLVYPENTKLTMIDRVLNETYYYNVTKEDEQNGKFMYSLKDFILMGTEDKKYDEKLAAEKYLKREQNLSYENFIFHVNFEYANINEDKIDNSLFLEIQDSDGETLIGVLGILRDRAKYSVYAGKESNIHISGDIKPAKIYLGEKATLDILTKYNQEIQDTRKINDTKYFDKQMGIRISFIDLEGNQVGIDSLLGIVFNLDGEEYFPSLDGSVRIKISEKISNVLSKIVIDTKDNKILSTGKYNLKIESFGSPDGVYYGDLKPQNIVIPLDVVNINYGLDVKINEKEGIINKKTGRNEKNERRITINTKYTSELQNPKLTMHLERRKYNSPYDINYEKVDMQKYIANTLRHTSNYVEYEYELNPINNSEISKSFSLKENLKSGTYRVKINLYDDEKLIASSYDYLVIK